MKAYLLLQCNSGDAHKYLARDLREGLAEQLIADEPSKGGD